MALQFQLQQFPFTYGLQEGVDPRQVPPGTLTTAENVAWKQQGRIGKRYGTSVLTANILGGGSLSAASRLFTRGDELCLIDGSNLYSYSPTLAKWKGVGKVPNVGITWSTLLDTAGGVGATDAALSAAGVLVHAWLVGDPTTTASAALYVQANDYTSGGSVLAPTLLSASGNTRIRVLTIGTTAIVLALNGANVVAYTIDLTTMTVAAGSNLRTDSIAAPAPFDACVIGSNFVIIYSVAGSVDLYSYNASLTQQATATVEAVTGAAFCGIAGATGEALYVVYSSGAVNVRVAIHDADTLAQDVAPATVESLAAGTLIHASVCRYDATNGLIAYSSSPGRTTTYSIPSAGTVDTTSERGTWGVTMSSRPFMLGGACYLFAFDLPISFASDTFPGTSTVLLGVDVSTIGGAASYVPHRYVGLPEVLVGGMTKYGNLPNVVAVSSTSAIVTTSFLASAPQGSTIWRCGARLVNVTVGSSLPGDMWRTVEQSEVYLAGGVLSAYDSDRVFDYGYSRAPLLSFLSAAGTAGSLAAGSYLYSFLREYRSAAGVLHRGPTATASVTAAATNTVTASLIGVNLSNKQDLTSGFGSSTPVSEQLVTYRSTVNGTVYQRLTYDPRYNTTVTDATAQTQSFADTRADSNIGDGSTALSSRPAIYTTGGVLDDYQPPASVTMFHHADRLWCLAGDERAWWYSKAFQDDLGVAPGFNPAFRVVFDTKQTAGASMDDKAVFFSEAGISYMLGVGPAANGGSSDFGQPMPIQTDVGCTNARSVVSMPDGLMFQSARGIYLLTRGLELVWIGRPIKDTLASYPNVTSATLVAKHNEVRFTANNNAGTAGVVFVYDYVAKQWSVSKYTTSVASGPIADACMWNGVWTFVSTTGAVYYEDTSTYLDATSWVTMKLETAWIAAAGPLAFQSVRTFSLHGQSYTDHDLTISVGFDSSTSYPQTITHLAESTVTTVGVEECETIIGTRRKCATIRFKVEDATPTTGTVGTGQGPAFDMMGIEVGIKAGFAGVPATKRG